MNLKDKTVCLIDSGTYLSRVEILKKSFGRTLYFNPCESQFPTSNEARIGYGIEGVELINPLVGDRQGIGFWDCIDEIDLFIFLDVGQGDIQEYLRKQGKRVWGSGHGDDLELFRWESKKLLKQIGLPVNSCHRIVGIKALRAFLAENEDKWVKISGTRGDQESFHHQDLTMTEPILKQMESRIGLIAEIMEFVVESPIHPAQEIGMDTICIDGKYPQKAMQGIEVKDEGYVCAVVPYDDFPEQARIINDKLAPLLERYHYRNDFCTEIRVPENLKPYLIDFTARSGSPPSELSQVMISNWPEIYWFGAEGKLIEPEWEYEYGAQAIIYSSWAATHPQPIRFPDEVKDHIKLKNYCVVNGQTQILPQMADLCEIGSVVAGGKTLIEAVLKVQEIAEQIEGQSIKIRLDSLPKAIGELQKAKEAGIKFKITLPTPEEINQALTK